MLTRQEIAARIRKILESNSIQYLDFFSASDIVFDFVVKLREILVIKVLKDVESLKSDVSRNLLQIAESLASVALVVAEYDKKKKIPDFAIGIRHGVPFVNLATFERLVNGQRPFIEYTRGGPYVRVRVKDEQRLKELLQSIGLSRRRILEILRSKDARLTVSVYKYIRDKEVVLVKEIDPRELCQIELPSGTRIVTVSKAPHDSSLLKNRKVEVLVKVKEDKRVQQFLELSDLLEIEPLIVRNLEELKLYTKKYLN